MVQVDVESLCERMREACEKGRHIDAVKLIREGLGFGFLGAKRFYDEHRPNLEEPFRQELMRVHGLAAVGLECSSTATGLVFENQHCRIEVKSGTSLEELSDSFRAVSYRYNRGA